MKNIVFILLSIFVCLRAQASCITNQDVERRNPKNVRSTQASYRTDQDLISIVEQHNPKNVTPTQGILRTVYEAQPRQTAQHKFGQAFPINPEVLYQLMENCEGKTVLELGAAGGENALLLGLAGANHVYVNDIEAEEINHFQAKMKKLPKKLRKKFTAICADCFTLNNTLKPHSIDILYIRNLFHFFKPSQYDDFFSLIKTLLKPGGIFAMNVNSKSSLTDPVLLSNPETTVFCTERLIYDPLISQRITIVDIVCKPCEESEVDPTSYVNENVFYFDTGNGKSKTVNTVFTSMDKGLVEPLLNFVKDNQGKCRGKIRFLKNYSVLFSHDNLINIFKKYNFETFYTAYIGLNGHVLPEETEKPSPFISIIAENL